MPESSRRRLPVVAAALALVGTLAACADNTTVVGQDSPEAASSADPPPVGKRLVGLGHVAIAVPSGWKQDDSYCGTPMSDTISVYRGDIGACAVARPAGVESVDIYEGPADLEGERAVEIGGVEARREPVHCQEALDASGREPRVCRAKVYFPGDRVTFSISSSTDEAKVEALIAEIRVLPERVGVPDRAGISNDEQERSGAVYLALLERKGLASKVVTVKQSGVAGGFVRDVAPAPGTMLRPGDVVTVTVTADPAGPAEELAVGVNSRYPTDERDSPQLEDAQIRAGETITLGVGDYVWAYAFGKREETLAASTTGDALQLNDWDRDPNKGHSWIAKRTGTSRVTLTIKADGERVELGTFTVVVK